VFAAGEGSAVTALGDGPGAVDTGDPKAVAPFPGKMNVDDDPAVIAGSPLVAARATR
jgi:hypothetical protein